MSEDRSSSLSASKAKGFAAFICTNAKPNAIAHLAPVVAATCTESHPFSEPKRRLAVQTVSWEVHVPDIITRREQPSIILTSKLLAVLRECAKSGGPIRKRRSTKTASCIALVHLNAVPLVGHWRRTNLSHKLLGEGTGCMAVSLRENRRDVLEYEHGHTDHQLSIGECLSNA
jgi:hypothetical protein